MVGLLFRLTASKIWSRWSPGRPGRRTPAAAAAGRTSPSGPAPGSWVKKKAKSIQIPFCAWLTLLTASVQRMKSPLKRPISADWLGKQMPSTWVKVGYFAAVGATSDLYSKQTCRICRRVDVKLSGFDSPLIEPIERPHSHSRNVPARDSSLILRSLLPPWNMKSVAMAPFFHPWHCIFERVVLWIKSTSGFFDAFFFLLEVDSAPNPTKARSWTSM